MPVPRLSPLTPLRALAIVLLLALLGRGLLLAADVVSFHSDEAVVGLMARHITQGSAPVFFYGQAYMGSLDAWLIAAGFALFGESVLTIRIVQSALYLLAVALSFAAGWRLSGSVIVASVSGLTLAVPPTLLALYTTATLGGYNETLILGAAVIILAWDVAHEHASSGWRWLALGLCAGLGWWTNGLIVVYALPAAALLLWTWMRQRRIPLGGLGLALLGFAIGSLPWWLFNLGHDFAALRFYLAPGTLGPEFAAVNMAAPPLGERLLGLLLFGLPAVLGLRFPWSGSYFALPVGVLVLALFVAALVQLARRDGMLKPGARGLLLGMLDAFAVVFLVSRFSFDPTGRYFLTLSLPLGIAFGALVAGLRRAPLRWAVAALVIGYFAAGQISAALGPLGLTTQFNTVEHIANDDDQALIDFLDQHDVAHGYTTYWVSFRLAFLSGERLQFSAALPPKPDLTYTSAYERLPAYRAAADGAEQIAYISANLPELEAALEAWFASIGTDYRRTQIGPYIVYHDFTPEPPRPPFPFIASS
jgi:4-amino-4-deoxy-L-arabinose transferase-like glycosyltransferase